MGKAVINVLAVLKKTVVMSSEAVVDAEMKSATANNPVMLAQQNRKHLALLVSGFTELHNKKQQEFKGHCFVLCLIPYAVCRRGYHHHRDHRKNLMR